LRLYKPPVDYFKWPSLSDDVGAHDHPNLDCAFGQSDTLVAKSMMDLQLMHPIPVRTIRISSRNAHQGFEIVYTKARLIALSIIGFILLWKKHKKVKLWLHLYIIQNG
jgi:hypothetical protein